VVLPEVRSHRSFQRLVGECEDTLQSFAPASIEAEEAEEAEQGGEGEEGEGGGGGVGGGGLPSRKRPCLGD
jgi:hypothetical protein